MSTTVDLGKITASVTVGTTTTGAAGTNASVSNSGTTQDAVLNFTIPRGAQGVQGPQGIQGNTGPAGPTGPQGPMGDVAVITPEQQAAFTMYSTTGQNTDGPMTQKAVTDNLVASAISYDNSQSGIASNNVQDAITEMADCVIKQTPIDLSGFSGNAKYINSSNAWASASGSGQKSINLPVSAGETYILKANDSHNTIYAFLKSNTSVGNPVDFSAYKQGRETIVSGESSKIVIPDDTTLLYLYLNSTSSSYLPTVTKLEYFVGEFKTGEAVSEISLRDDVNTNLSDSQKKMSIPNLYAVERAAGVSRIVDLSGYSGNAKYINSSNAWASASGSGQKSINLPVSAGDVYRLNANLNHQTIYALLRSNTRTGTPVDFSSESYGRVSIQAGNSTVITIPDDTTLLYLYFNSASDSFLPVVTQLYGLGQLENRLSSSIPKYNFQRGIMFGDSITYGVYSYFNNGERWNGVQLGDSIATYIGNIVCCPVDNLGKRGTGYVADTRDIDNAWELAQVTDFSQYDLVIMMYGVNDYIQGVSIGSLADNIEGTVVGNMSRVFNKILNDNPYCKILCVGSYNTWGQVSQGGDYTSDQYYGDITTDYGLGFAISGKTLRQHLDAQKEVCEHYHVQYFCLADEGVVNLINIKNVLVDGLHPTLELRKYIAQEIAKYLV